MEDITLTLTHDEAQAAMSAVYQRLIYEKGFMMTAEKVGMKTDQFCKRFDVLFEAYMKLSPMLSREDELRQIEQDAIRDKAIRYGTPNRN